MHACNIYKPYKLKPGAKKNISFFPVHSRYSYWASKNMNGEINKRKRMLDSELTVNMIKGQANTIWTGM